MFFLWKYDSDYAMRICKVYDKNSNLIDIPIRNSYFVEYLNVLNIGHQKERTNLFREVKRAARRKNNQYETQQAIII